ncbi:HEAT repeat domain-containing protein [Paenibacillus alkalitolerans]|uniref:HEAT repeat domain-containing protein n=1 Tax=Paenibacillus alkalitolerans TaxID=2799335 RepID=UPI0018F75BE6|nr:HEAT repeat domain-containing protein [Paenibacillus alkalitolerans]
MAGNEPLLLTDEQMRKFIAEGFLILKTDFPKQFHDRLMEQLDKVYKEEGNPGNNLLPRIRELQKVFDHPVITGALTSVLGPRYMLHAHRHGHFNAIPTAGGWHKDSYWGYSRLRNHHPWWAMVMYFPQDTPVELGPTGVMPGTQNYETRTFESDDTAGEALASGEAGTFALIHYDLWHRSTPNLLGRPRYMLKFEFMRTTAPDGPSWDNRENNWSTPDKLNLPIARHELMWEETWSWLRGKVGAMANTMPGDPQAIQALAAQLEDGFEPTALNAAYELACRGTGAVNRLLEALRHENIRVSRLAAYGLSVSGEEAVNGLISALDDTRTETVCHAAFALGELRHAAASAMPKLIALLGHPSELVRRTVTEAVSIIREPADEAVNGLIRALQDSDVQVRFMAGLSLTRFGAAAAAAVPYLEKALDDENRYVRAHAAEALRYIGTDRAKDALIKELFNLRWCSNTTPANTFYP